MSRAVIAALVGAAVLATGCGGDTRAAVPLDVPDSVVAQASDAQLDPPAEQLTEPKLTAVQVIQMKAGQYNTFCTGWTAIEELDEPNPESIDQLLGYARLSRAILGQIDPLAQIHDRRSTDLNKKTSIPKSVVTAISAERAALYSYQYRLELAKTLMGSRSASDHQKAQRLAIRAASVLAGGDYARTDATLESYYRDLCTG